MQVGRRLSNSRYGFRFMELVTALVISEEILYLREDFFFPFTIFFSETDAISVKSYGWYPCLVCMDFCLLHFFTAKPM
jgi:hypothetical protein